MTKKKSILPVSDDLCGLFSANSTPCATVDFDRMTLKRHTQRLHGKWKSAVIAQGQLAIIL
ncbi:hypothetical protein [Neobacillus cucumis]|uniref:hypothetical protein n=1 Tax=Neobacillus cucumis TaxID=1740721 RepID=UPI0019639611|nr:hypothetical protein [Neobacillus cucumis]MBM7653063.1 hypothetical protein [Neobacillus cucumis]